MLQNYNVDITDFLRLSASGLKVADFVQVKEAIINRYKAAYGSDIDLSTASADGIFVNDLALIINNILKTVSTIYANLDVDYASGKYLDILCNLTNVSRKQATKSRASVEITNISASPLTIPSDLQLVDVSGAVWNVTSIPSPSVVLQSTESMSVICEAEIDGPVAAPAGYITMALDASLPLSIRQDDAAEIGSSAETDSSLRQRRSQSNGSQGVTVLESLWGALLNIAGIDDVKIYSNPSPETSSEPKDNTQLLGHSIYVILRKRALVGISNELIGKLIYEKLTPGISTTEFVGSGNGIGMTYEYIPSVIGSTVEVFNQNVHWKEAIGLTPAFSFTITPRDYFNANFRASSQQEGKWGQADEFETLASVMTSYLNSLSIGTTPSSFDIQQQILFADPMFKGRNTFDFVSATTFAENPDTYYNYTTFVVSKSGSNFVITLS